MLPYALLRLHHNALLSQIFHFPKFFNEELGVSMSSLAFWGTAAVCIDAVTDPLVGSWTDNLRTPWGRRRPFLAIVPLLLAATIFFHTPWWSDEEFNYGVWSVRVRVSVRGRVRCIVCVCITETL